MCNRLGEGVTLVLGGRGRLPYSHSFFWREKAGLL